MKITDCRKLPFERAIATLVITLLPLLYFYPAVKGDLALVQGDGWAANVGLRMLTGQSIAQGYLPLWNPYIFAGMPLLATIHPGALYPPNWLFALLQPGAAMNVVVITTYHLAMIGAYRYARSLGINRTGAIVTGITFTFGGYMVMSMGQTPNIATAAWLPWVLLAIEKLNQKVSVRWIILGAVFIALQFFAGIPQITWYTVLVGGAYFLFLSLTRKQPRLQFALGALAMVACGALLSAIQLLPLRELQQQGGRAQISYEYFAAFSFPPRQLPALIFPYFFGGAHLLPYRVPYWGQSGIFVTCGYVGILALLLIAVAAIGIRKRPIIWFWLAVALVSLTLSFGDYLPFGLNHRLHQVPIYNLFRASFRHLFEFTFACAVLAGFGVNYLSQCSWEQSKRTFRSAAMTITAIVFLTLLVYLFGGQYLATDIPLPTQSNSLANPEALVPLFFFLSSVAALWHYARRRSVLSVAPLILVLLADLVAYGHFLEWRAYTFNVADRLQDPPTVKYIKAHEPDLNSFRILSHSTLPFGTNYELLNYPNNSIARGIQSANGYDILRLHRPAEIMGAMNVEGVVQDRNAFNLMDQGFNVLNIKYLLFERVVPLEGGEGIIFEGIRFRQKSLELNLKPGGHQELTANGMAATELAIISTMSNSTHLVDGAPVLKIRLHTKGGRVIERELQTGRDSSEWAYDRADVRSMIKHSRARVIESWPANDETGTFEGHRYLARLVFERAEIEKVEMNYIGTDAEIGITRASLYDSSTGLSTFLGEFGLPPERWQKLASFGAVDLYQNLKAMPRAWFVNKIEAVTSDELLSALRKGAMHDGRPFDPDRVALLDKDDRGASEISLPPVETKTGIEVAITRYEPQRIELKARNPQAGFLVLSEVYYPGWEAKVDGARTPIYRADYSLRGLRVPAGEHKVELIYVAPSFRTGAFYSGIGVVLLICGAFSTQLRRIKGNPLLRIKEFPKRFILTR